MSFNNKYLSAVKNNNSILCVGLDTNMAKIPACLHNDPNPILKFNQEIIDATKEYVCAYKPNIAFYEEMGVAGLDTLIKTIAYIPENIPVILDAKRGDIGNTASSYAKSIYEYFRADATTLNPYMGMDTLKPFIDYKDKMNFILCLTSNPGSADFQMQGSPELYKQIAKKVADNDIHENCGLVVGATHPDNLKEIREIAPDLPFLVPGVGAQQGDLEAVLKNGLDKNKQGLIINASRSIIYASNDKDFGEKAGEAAKKLRDEINSVV